MKVATAEFIGSMFIKIIAKLILFVCHQDELACFIYNKKGFTLSKFMNIVYIEIGELENTENY